MTAEKWDAARDDGRTCPECRGERGYSTRPFCSKPYEHEDINACDCGGGSVWHECRVCRGSGELVGLPRSIYMARGGAAPVQFRGHA